jgi:hypothetical protein
MYSTNYPNATPTPIPPPPPTATNFSQPFDLCSWVRFLHSNLSVFFFFHENIQSESAFYFPKFIILFEISDFLFLNK